MFPCAHELAKQQEILLCGYKGASPNYLERPTGDESRTRALYLTGRAGQPRGNFHPSGKSSVMKQVSGQAWRSLRSQDQTQPRDRWADPEGDRAALSPSRTHRRGQALVWLSWRPALLQHHSGRSSWLRAELK